MEGLQLENVMDSFTPPTRSTKTKPAKRKWREIEAINDKKRLQKELMDLDGCLDYKYEDIEL